MGSPATYRDDALTNTQYSPPPPPPGRDLCLIAGRAIERFEWYAPDGAKYNLHSLGDTFMLSESGSGMPPIEYVTQRGPFQDGETVTNAFLRPRVVQLMLRNNTHSRAQYWTARDTLVRILRPTRAGMTFAPGHLRYYLANGSVRQLDAVIQKGPEFVARNLSQWDEFSFQEILQFIAHNPVWYDPTPHLLTVTSGSQLVFPIIFPIVFSGLDATLNVVYKGSWKEYPTITITGGVTSPKITNNTTGEFILLNYTVALGRVVTISLKYGQKTVTLDDGTNLIQYVDATSSLSTFHLEPDPGATGGVNQIVVHGSGGSSAANVTLTYYDRYLGI